MEYNIKHQRGSSHTRCVKENHPQKITKSSHLCFKVENDEKTKHRKGWKLHQNNHTWKRVVSPFMVGENKIRHISL